MEPLFSHEKLLVYGKARELLALATGIVRGLPRGMADEGDEMWRAARGAMRNIRGETGLYSPRTPPSSRRAPEGGRGRRRRGSSSAR